MADRQGHAPRRVPPHHRASSAVVLDAGGPRAPPTELGVLPADRLHAVARVRPDHPGRAPGPVRRYHERGRSEGAPWMTTARCASPASALGERRTRTTGVLGEWEGRRTPSRSAPKISSGSAGVGRPAVMASSRATGKRRTSAGGSCTQGKTRGRCRGARRHEPMGRGSGELHRRR